MATDQHKICLLNYYKSPHFKITKKLRPLNTSILSSYFSNNVTFMSRDEYADGSCFFHSVVSCLNIHDNLLDKDNRYANQKQVFSNLKQRIMEGGLLDDTKTSKFNNFLHKHLFVHDDYQELDRETQKSLGHKLRTYIKDTLDRQWEKFWDFDNPKVSTHLRRVHSKNHVKELLSDIKVWADVYMIMYVMHILNMNIWFFDDMTSRIYCGVQGSSVKSQPTILVLWTNHSHFQPIVKLDCHPETGEPFIKSLFTYDDDIVREIEAAYNRDGCAVVSKYHVLG